MFLSMYLSFFCFHQCMFIVCKCIVCFYQSMCIRVFHLSLFLEFSLANFMSDDDSPQEYGDFLSEFFYNGLLPPFASKVSSFLPFSWYFNHIYELFTQNSQHLMPYTIFFVSKRALKRVATLYGSNQYEIHHLPYLL